MPVRPSGKPQSYQSRSNPMIHASDGLTFTGSVVVDLNIRTNNFVVSPSFVDDGAAATALAATRVSWTKFTSGKLGRFTLFVDKCTAGPVYAAATAPAVVAFIAVVLD